MVQRTSLDTSRRGTKFTCTTCMLLSFILLGLDHERLTYNFAGRDFRPDRRQRPGSPRTDRLNAVRRPNVENLMFNVQPAQVRYTVRTEPR